MIIGVLAAFGVPRFIKSVERSKAAEAFEYLSSDPHRPGTIPGPVRHLRHQRHRPRHQVFAPPKYFALPATFVASSGGTTSLQNSWSLTLTRTGSSAGYGAYTVIFTETGLDTSSSIMQGAAATDINPISN